MVSPAPIRLRALLAACLFVFAAAAQGQTPRVLLRFDGNLNDASGAGVVTSPVTPSAGFSPTYATDRNGVAQRALVFTSSSSLQLVASSLPGNSNQALGLRNAAGTNTSFTLSAWVRFTSLGSGQGYSTIFGNLGSGAGTLHAGLNVDSDKAHFGFDAGNDVTGSTASVVPDVWYHIAFVYDTAATDGPVQRIYVNGVPEATRTGVTNTIKAADLYVGNWGAATNAANDLKGHLDDVAVYNVALSPDRIQALADGANPLSLPAAGTYSGPKLAGFAGAEGLWGIREIRGYPNISLSAAGGSSLVNADRVLRAYAVTPAGTVAEFQRSVINMVDDESPGNLGVFPNEADFGTNTPGPDDDQVFVAKGAVRIVEEDDYTFGFLGDEGSRLRILGKQWASSTRLATANVANPAHGGDSLWHSNETVNSQTLGVVHLTPGDYNLELVWWEGTGTSAIEIFAARGAKTAIDGTFQLVGNTAAGGLELVRDPDTVPQILTFTVNGASSLEVHSGVPSTFTMAWQTNAIPTSVTITPSPGAVGQTGSLLVASPASTTTYTLTATDGVNTAVKTVTVFVDSLPVINSFIANDTTVTAGTSVTLIWSAAGATSLTLQPGNIDVTGQTSRVVTPTVDTTYTLIATNIEGSVQQSVAIDVGVAPVVNTFGAADATPLYGAETSLNWDVSGATTLSINQGIGTVTGTTGSVSVTPIATTTYTLTATNAYGVSTRNTTVNQATPIGVLTPGFTARRVSATTPFPFATAPGTPQSYLQSALGVLGLLGPPQNAGATTTANYTTVNFSDGADGDFTTGNSAFPGGGGDNFAVQITATLVVNSPGEYTFVVNSDDGARLRVDGVDVITDDSTHFPGAGAGRIMLTKRTSTLELVYYDATGGAEVELGWVRPNQTFQLLGVINSAAPIVRGQVLISEFMAENGNTLLDEDTDSSDWIEIWNSTTAPVNLATYYLTDDPAVPNKWNFPSMNLAANAYLVVFASGKNKVNPAFNLHTNFSLAQTGDYLALTRSDGAGGFITVSEFAPLFPPQTKDKSYGSSDSEGYIGFMETPTPGQPNARTVLGFVEDVVLSHQRGRYTAAFNLALSTPTPGATIRYTTNGSLPTANTGTIYTAPFPVGVTTCLRVAAFKAGWEPTEIDTHSYLFIDDIVNQTTATATAKGFPSGAVNGQIYRYGMTLGNVTSGGGNLQGLKNALAAAPSVCITTPIANLVDAATGIYSNPAGRGLFWERPTSMEYISAAGTSEFQIDCGVRIRGGFSRSTSNPKHAFHISFRASLYDGDLKYRLFGTNGAARFDAIDLRCSQNYSWAFQNDSQNTMLREEWARVTQGDLGQPWPRLGYFHLYINGIYWGVYEFEERVDANYGATYLGGEPENYDNAKSTGSPGGYNTEMTDGNFIAWQSLYTQCLALKNDTGTEASRTTKYMRMRGLNSDGTPNATYPVLLDADNLIDYELLVFYDGSFDSPMSTFLNNASNNWFGIRDRLGMRGFTYYVHDHEHGMNSGTQSYNRIGPWGGSGNNNWGQGQYGSRETFTKFNPHYVHEFLCFSAEYRQRFADRVQKHCFNGGALTTTASTARANTLATQVDAIIHAEAARWGSPSLNRNSWLTAKNTVLNFVSAGGTHPGGSHPPLTPGDRASIIVQQLRAYQDPLGTAKALFPASTLAAPNFSGQFGGPVTNPHSFNITNPNGAGTAIYYTVNGADPRAIGGAIAAGAQTGASPIPITLNSSSTVRARIYNSATLQWSGLVEAEYLVGALASATNLVISKIHYHPLDTNPDAEFIELMNIGALPVDLTNVRFTIGVQFQFPDGFLLAPGGRTLVVKNKAAFDAAYPGVLPAQVGGIYAGVFSNGSLDNAGEQLQLLGAINNNVIRDFIYEDNNPPVIPPWPTSPDGEGPCLVLINPGTNPDHSLAVNWRPSNTSGGTPGASDATSYAAWAVANGISNPNLDNDFDGSSNFGEYARGTNPNVSNPDTFATLGSQTLSVGGNVGEYLTLSFRRPLGRDDASYNVKATGDLATWQNAVLVGTGVFNGDGTETLTYRYPVPKSADTQQFLQLQMTKLP